jgi:hypothetical protein
MSPFAPRRPSGFRRPTRSASDQRHVIALSYTLSRDTTQKYDAATIWLDNRQIEGKIAVMAIAGGGVLGD